MYKRLRCIENFGNKIFFCVFVVIGIILSVDCIYRIIEKNDMEYHIEYETYTYQILDAGQEGDFILDINSDNDYLVLLDANLSSWEKGTVEYTIGADLADESGSIEVEDSLLIPISDEILKGSYVLRLKNCSDYPLGLYVDDNNQLKTTEYMHFRYKRGLLFCWGLIFIIFCALIWIHLFWQIDDYTKYIISLVVVGMVFILLIPPFTAPDELRRFERAYDVSKGIFIEKGYQHIEGYNDGVVPICNIDSSIWNMKLTSQSNGINYAAETNSKINIDVFINKLFERSGDTVSAPLIGTAQLSVLSILPQVIGIWVAKLLSVNGPLVIYISRITNFLATTCLLGVGYKVTPLNNRHFYYILSMIPCSVFMRSTHSNDGLLVGAIMVLFAYVMKIMQNGEIGKKDMCVLFFTAILVSLIKLPYLVLYLSIPLLIQGAQNKKITMFIKKSILLFIVPCIFYLISSKVMGMGVSSDLNTINGTMSFINNIVNQNNIFNIANMIRTVINESILRFGIYFNSGLSFGSAYSIEIIYMLLLLVAAIQCCSGIYIYKKQKNIIFCVGTLTWIAIVVVFAGMYGCVNEGQTWGIQGRYLLPIIPFQLFILSHNNDEQFIILEREKIHSIALIILYVFSIGVYVNYWI